MIIVINRPEKFSGELAVPGDKSITHRAAMLGAISRGVTEIKGYLDAEDCHSTFRCLQALGVNISFRSGRLLIEGRDMKLKEPTAELDAGNSGTTARLLFGILAGQPFETTMTGDQSLQKRPMKRIIDPLTLMGASFKGDGNHLPLTIRGGNLKAVNYKSPKASAQLKSAILMAALFAEGRTTIEEPHQSRNHTELMLDQFGATINTESRRITLEGKPQLRGSEIIVPGDISTAAFFMVAAVLIPGSEVLLKNVGVNPTRSGIIDALQLMGADLELQEKRLWGREPVADIMVRGGEKLKGISVEGRLIPRLIDEIPVLAVAAATAEGQTVFRDADELRVKESDRITALVGQLSKLGAAIEETDDGMVIEGSSELKGAEVDSCGDHRIAMAMAVAGLAAQGETAVCDAEVIRISFPGFMAGLRKLTLK